MDRKDRIERVLSNRELQHIFKLEPRIERILQKARWTVLEKSYDRISVYSALKRELEGLVGWDATNEELRTQKAYELVVEGMSDLLPSDCDDLYPDGGSPGNLKHPCHKSDAEYYSDEDRY